MSAGELAVPFQRSQRARVRKVTQIRSDNQPAGESQAKIEARGLSFYYGKFKALEDISLRVQSRRITALIGPSGCGKSTFLRCLNRMYEVVTRTSLEGQVYLDFKDIRSFDVADLRQKVGMVFQKPTPFRKSIFDNVAFGPRCWGTWRKSILCEKVENSLRRAALWEEVKDRLHEPALRLSGGQQQRLCVARALASDPEVLLLDEPCSALDPIATAKIEELLYQLSSTCTVVIVTHNMEQAARVADFTSFFVAGRLIEFGSTKQIFEKPAKKETEDYITGRFG
jgi:phosphate transport system ATP-binding protein